MPRSKPRRASSLKAICFAIVALLLISYRGWIITHTPRVLMLNLEQQAALGKLRLAG